MQLTVSKPQKCKYCYGYGWWPMGRLVPIGEWDSKDFGNKVVKCPWCGAGFDDNCERFDILVMAKAREDNNGKSK